MKHTLRRTDRRMEQAEAMALLAANSHGVLATVDQDGAPYANPISYVLYEGRIYFHSAAQGHKVENMARDSRVTFTVIGNVDMVAAGAHAAFESVIARGRALPVTDYQEELAVFYAMKRLFMPDTVEDTPDSMARLKGKYILYRLEAEEITGKARKPEGGGH